MSGEKSDDLAKKVTNGDRRALARAITLVESTRPDHRETAHELLQALRQTSKPAIRIGLSGTPGVGKSTFIESFGMMLAETGLKVAVLAVDPSSTRSGGSILGDKTRMPELSRHPNAFIRPSPSRSALGGVAARTRAVIDLCEGAKFDVIIIETVGVGQSETMVADMSDAFLLLLAPAGGDELQGVKRGIMERADIVVVNKADGDLKAEATRTAAEYGSALRLLRHPETCPEDFPKAMTISAINNSGIDTVWTAIEDLVSWRRSNGVFEASRKSQNLKRFKDAIESEMLNRLRKAPDFADLWAKLEDEILQGNTAPDEAAETILNEVFSKTRT